jgi:hypothetical protein
MLSEHMVVEQRRSPWMDSTESPMNPCSVETIPEPIELAMAASG